MTDRACIRECTQYGVHYATCEHSGPTYDGAFPCRGCAPRECRDGSLICDRCFGRMRALLNDTPDLLARLHAIADPTKAKVLDDIRVRSTPTEPVAPVSADLLDAITAIEQVLRIWNDWGRDLATISNNLEAVTWMTAAVLDRHPETDGTRDAWSIQDAIDRWGVERRDRNPRPYDDDTDNREELVEPIPEWDNPIVGRDDAERIAGSAATLRRWIRNGDITPVGEVYIAGRRTRLFRTTDLHACKNKMQERTAATRYHRKEMTS